MEIYQSYYIDSRNAFVHLGTYNNVVTAQNAAMSYSKLANSQPVVYRMKLAGNTFKPECAWIYHPAEGVWVHGEVDT